MDNFFTDRVYHRILERASEEAVRLDCEYVGTDLVLLALLRDGSPAASVLARLGVHAELVLREIASSIPPVRSPVRVGRPYRTRRVKQAIEHTIKESRKPGQPRCVEPEHLLLGLLSDEDNLAAQILLDLGLSLPDVRAAVRAEWGLPSLSSGITTAPASPAAARPAEENVQRAEEVDHLQNAPSPPASMSLHLPGVERPIVHQGLLARLLSFLGLLLDSPSPTLAEEAPLPPPDAPLAPLEEPVTWGPGAMARFTDRARKVMQLANQEAQRFNHDYIGTQHILLGLVKEDLGAAAAILKNLGVDLRTVRWEVEKIVQPGQPDVLTPGKLPPTPRARNVVECAAEEARLLDHNYVGVEHLLLGLLREPEGVAAQVLLNLGVTPGCVREELRRLLS